jgi:RND superfamily putative drug exporter
VIERITKAVTKVPGIGRVQSITRPEGKPLKFSTIPAQLSMSGTFQEMNRSYMDKAMALMKVQADDMQKTVDTMDRMIALMEQMSATTHSMVGKTNDMAVDIAQLRDYISNFDDFFRPIRNYLYWEPHCYDIPICWSLRSMFDALDGVDTMTDDFQNVLPDLNRMDALMPQMIATMPPSIETMKSARTMMLTTYQSQSSQQDQSAAMSENQSAMGDAFNNSHNDDTFYLPPEIFANKDFQRGMSSFISPNGHAVRFIISHENDPLSADGIQRIDAIKSAAFEAIKGTPLEGSRVYIGGTASTFKDMQEGNKYDLIIAGVAALTMIFIIMLLITRSVIAAAVIVGTVVLSLGASFGLSVLFWQHLLGIQLQFMVMAMAVIILLAVGADYNLLLVARMKEEIPAGINTGIIRAMGGSGSVVTAAGLVFAFTMISMAVSAMVVVAQVGTTIGLGLLFDTLVIRAFMTPSIAALMGRWFWWPQVVRQRPVPVGR